MAERLWMLAAVAVCVASGAPLLAQESGSLGDPASASHPFVRVYRDADGLPQNTVHALAIDGDGILWAGTQDGLASYDGRSWERENGAVRGGALFVRDLLRGSDDSLWVASQAHGLLRRLEGRWVELDGFPAGLAGQRVNALAESLGGESSTLWVGTHDHGLFALRRGVWRRYGPQDGLPAERIWSLRAEGAARLWIGTQRGVARLDLVTDQIDRPDGTPVASVSSLELTRERGGAVLWAGTYGDGLHRWSPAGWTKLGLEDGLPSLFVTDLAPRADAPDEVWIATDGGGVAWADSRAVHRFEVGPALASRAVYRVLETGEDEGGEALWIGTRNGGLLRVTERLWRSLAAPADGVPPPISALLVTSSPGGGDELWLGTDGEGLARWQGGVWQRFRRGSGELSEDVVLALLETYRFAGGRRIWVGTRNGGVDVWDGTSWRHHGTATGALPSDLVQALAEVQGAGGRSEVWVGTREGLAIYDGASWRRPEAGEGWPVGSIEALLADSAGDPAAVWIGTSEGLWRVAGSSVRRWEEADGLPQLTVQALHLRRSGGTRRELWIGTDGGGLALLDPDRLDDRMRGSASPAVPALSNAVVYALVEDRKGRLYASTNQGVARFRPTAEGGVADLEELTVFQGLPVNQGSRGAAALDARGRVWIGTVGGVALLDPERERRDETANPILLRATLPRRGNETLRTGESVKRSQAEFRFRYRLLSFVGEALNRYRTELVGFDAGVSEWTASAERDVSGLPPGDYLFRVWGRDAAGNVSLPAELEFRVLPAAWETAWARALAVLALFAAVAGFAQRRARLHARRERELENLVAERTSQLEDANKRLARLSFLDPLTEVANRRRFDDELESEWRRAVRHQAPIALMMIDIDDFKAYNDNYGHPRGDEVIRRVAEILSEGLRRSGDLLARFGGEEFAVLLPATDVEGAALLAEALRVRVAVAEIPHGASRVAEHVTVSCGVAAAKPVSERGASALVGAADGALYAAKRSGRNRVERARG